MQPTIDHLHHLLALLLFALLSTTGWTGCAAAELDAKTASFNGLADGVIAQAVAGKVDVPAAQKSLAQMVDLAAWFAGQYKVKYPAGAKTMDFMLGQRDRFAGMSLADIDTSFESEAINKAHGAELGIDITEEENEHFGNAIDLFVHPATASIAIGLWAKDAQSDHLKRAIAELQEVQEHCRKVAAALAK